ncbi:MAG: RDD family protein [Candidatus Sulfotelmatobacter sp.]
MNCLRCGEDCRCDPESSVAATPRLTPDANEILAPAPRLAPETLERQTDGCPISRDLGEKACPEPVEGWGFDTPSDEDPTFRKNAKNGAPDIQSEEPGSAWRDELTAKLSSYRARRKPRPPRYPSLRLRFEADSSNSAPVNAEPAAFETRSHQALALDGMTELPTPADAECEPSHSESSEAGGSALAPARPRTNHGARIIEFPRSPEFAPAEFRSDFRTEFRTEFIRSDPPAPALYNELAGPVMAPPRILEVPEIVPPPPALGGITIEAAEPKGFQRRPGIEIPLQAAPLAWRMSAVAIDGLIILLATALFGLIFWKVTGMRPPVSQVLGLMAAVPCLLWAAYQYLLLVYAGTTPGLRFAGLDVARFDGTLANRPLRRWRVVASYLGAVSLGMGYVWVFLDEDALCWHDRITHTYLAPKETGVGVQLS